MHVKWDDRDCPQPGLATARWCRCTPSYFGNFAAMSLHRRLYLIDTQPPRLPVSGKPSTRLFPQPLGLHLKKDPMYVSHLFIRGRVQPPLHLGSDFFWIHRCHRAHVLKLAAQTSRFKTNFIEQPAHAPKPANIPLKPFAFPAFFRGHPFRWNSNPSTPVAVFGMTTTHLALSSQMPPPRSHAIDTPPP